MVRNEVNILIEKSNSLSASIRPRTNHERVPASHRSGLDIVHVVSIRKSYFAR